MAHITNKLRGLVAAFVAVFAALALVPGVTGTGQIILNFTEGTLPEDLYSIEVYQVATIELSDSGNNTTELVEADGMDGAVKVWGDNDAPTATEAKNVADKATTAMIYEGATITADGNTVTISNLPAGVYYINVPDSTDYAYQNMIASVEPYRGDNGQWEIGPKEGVEDAVATITVKCVEQGFEKTIVVNGAETDHKFAVGDTITYRIDFNVTANMAEFWIEDDLTGADFQSGTVALHVGENTYTLDDDLFSVVTEGLSDNVDFKFTLNSDGVKTVVAGGGKAYITYDAEINDDATLDTGVDNVAKSSENGSSTANQDFAQIQVKKYEKGDQGKLLEGAKFGLYSSDDNELIAEEVTDSNGLATFDAILDPEQTYYVQEISAPSGYQLNDAKFTVKADPEDGQFKLLVGEITQVGIENMPSGKDQGLTLPTTGGAGTVALTAAGVVLVAGAAAFIVRSRKQN